MNGDNHDKKKFKLPNNPWIYIVIALAIMMMITTTRLTSLMNGSVTQTTYSDFISKLNAGKVKSARISADKVVFTIKDSSVWPGASRYETVLVDDPNLVSRLIKAGVDDFSGETQSSFLAILVGYILPLVFYIVMIFWIFRLFKGGGSGVGAMSFGKSGAKLYEISGASKKFTDVAGQDEAKEALVELVDFLHDPSKYKAIGAKLPRGALLVGPPGTGKTLIAQAVAGEANVPFFFVSGSAFVEMFVGTGAARVRDLFKQASEKAPCIVFIDEIDAIGKKRDNIGISSNDEREQALNQLLAEMDGFDPSKGIVVLGATNRPEILDKALLRPGRFDRRITVDLPDLKGREAVLRVHARNVLMDDKVDYASIARATVGASGADLANIINEAALRAVKMGRQRVIQEDLEASVDVVIAGSERKSLVIPDKERRMIACHEIGHAIVAAKQKNSAPVHKITIIPRTSGALGYTMQVDEDEHVLLSKENLLARLAVMAAGRASEEFMFSSCTTGASNDIEQMTKLARSMVTRFGMSKQFGMMALETGASAYLGTDGQLACSVETATKIDEEVRGIIAKAFDCAMEIIKENSQKLAALSQTLLEKETLTGEEFMKILNDSPAEIDKPALED